MASAEVVSGDDLGLIPGKSGRGSCGSRATLCKEHAVREPLLLPRAALDPGSHRGKGS